MSLKECSQLRVLMHRGAKILHTCAVNQVGDVNTRRSPQYERNADFGFLNALGLVAVGIGGTIGLAKLLPYASKGLQEDVKGWIFDEDKQNTPTAAPSPIIEKKDVRADNLDLAREALDSKKKVDTTTMVDRNGLSATTTMTLEDAISLYIDGDGFARFSTQLNHRYDELDIRLCHTLEVINTSLRLSGGAIRYSPHCIPSRLEQNPEKKAQLVLQETKAAEAAKAAEEAAEAAEEAEEAEEEKKDGKKKKKKKKKPIIAETIRLTEAMEQLIQSSISIKEALDGVDLKRQLLLQTPAKFKEQLVTFIREKDVYKRYTSNPDAWIPVINMVQIVYSNSSALFDSTSSNWILMGPPGSGKTTTAQLAGEFLYHIGIYVNLPITTTKGDFLSSYAGGASLAMTDGTLMKAIGRTMVIDEAYTVFSDGEGRPHKFAGDIASRFLTFITDNMGLCSLIPVGYASEMENQFLTANAGFDSRFPYQVTLTPMETEVLRMLFMDKMDIVLGRNTTAASKNPQIRLGIQEGYYTVKANIFIKYLIKHSYFSSFSRDVLMFMSGVTAYNGALLLRTDQLKALQKKMGIRYLYEVMKFKYCRRRTCSEVFRRILTPVLEPCELHYYFMPTPTPTPLLHFGLDTKKYSSVQYFTDSRLGHAALLTKLPHTGSNTTLGNDQDWDKFDMDIPWGVSLYADAVKQPENTRYYVTGCQEKEYKPKK